MLLFASFPTPKPQQAEIVQVNAPPLSTFFTTPSASKRLSASSASSIFASLGFKQQPRRTDSVLATPRASKCTHWSVTRFYPPASAPAPQDLKLGTNECCQRCGKQHYFHWVYVCDICNARACHNCRPKWADRAWGSFEGLLGGGSPLHGREKEKVVRSVNRGVEMASSVLETKRRSKRWSGGSWLKDKELT